MSLAAVLVIAVVLLVLGIVLRRRQGTMHSAKLASTVLIGVGVLGIVGVAVEIAMFFLSP